MKKLITATLVGLVMAGSAQAADYAIDTQGMHASVQFRAKHLGYSWLYGRFNEFTGTFSYDEENPAASTVDVTIQTTSLDSNHAERDKHLRSGDFLEVEKFPEAKFVSTSFEAKDNGSGVLVGDLTLKGVTKSLSIDVENIGGGKDPWGGYRMGFEGKVTFASTDFGIEHPAVGDVEMILSIEGVRR